MTEKYLATHRVTSSELPSNFHLQTSSDAGNASRASDSSTQGQCQRFNLQLMAPAQFMSPTGPFIHPTLSAFHHLRMLEVLPLITNSTHEIRSLQLGLSSYTTEDSTYVPGLLFCRLELSQKYLFFRINLQVFR